MSVKELHAPEIRAMLAAELAARKAGGTGSINGDVRAWARRCLVMAGPKHRLP